MRFVDGLHENGLDVLDGFRISDFGHVGPPWLRASNDGRWPAANDAVTNACSQAFIHEMNDPRKRLVHQPVPPSVSLVVEKPLIAAPVGDTICRGRHTTEFESLRAIIERLRGRE